MGETSQPGILTTHESASGFRAHLSSNVNGFDPALLTALAEYRRSDFLITGPGDFIDPQIATDPTTDYMKAQDAFSERTSAFLDRNDISMGMSLDEKRLIIDSVQTNAYAMINAEVSVGGRDANLIYIGEHSMTPRKELSTYSLLNESEFGARFNNLDMFTFRAFTLGHEAGHFSGENINSPVAVQAEYLADQEGFAFCEYLRQQGHKIDQPTLDAIRDMRSISALHMKDHYLDGRMIPDQDVIGNREGGQSIFEQFNRADHATGALLNGGTPNLDANTIENTAPVLRDELYETIGRAYISNYERLKREDPEMAKLASNTNDMVRAHRPFEPVINPTSMNSNGRPDGLGPNAKLLGMRISQNYPEIHYAFAEGALRSGVYKNDPAMQDILRDYTGAFRRQFSDTIDPTLVNDVTRSLSSIVAQQQTAAPSVAPIVAATATQATPRLGATHP